MNTTSESKTTVIIHDKDADGIAAAWCINKWMVEDDNETVLIPQRAGVNEIPVEIYELMEDPSIKTTVYMVDRTYPLKLMVELSKLVSRLVVIDH
jgi:hypothetical protein